MASDLDLTMSTLQEVAIISSAIAKESSQCSVTIVVAKPAVIERIEEDRRVQHLSPSTRSLLFTTAEDLQDMIEIAQLSDNGRFRTLNLLIGAGVSSIMFHVPSHFSELRVTRCTLSHDKRLLLIDGSSTYADIRLDEWEADDHPDHKLVIGRENGVRIRSANSTSSKQHSEKAMTDRPADERQGTKLALLDFPGRRWDEMKGRLAWIVGLLVAVTRFMMGSDASSKSTFYRYSALGMSSLTMEEDSSGDLLFILTTAGNALTLGLVAGALVYCVLNHFYGMAEGRKPVNRDQSRSISLEE